MKKYNQFINENKITYHKELCQDIWNGKILIPRIREKLLKIARDFFENIEIDTEISDILLVGSIANYNYTSQSDLDVHIKIDFTDVNDDIKLVEKVVDGEKFIWNLRHNIVIQGHDVELYIQDINSENISNGIYSLLNNKWLKEPTYNPPNVDTKDIDPKYDAYVYDIEELEKLSETDLDPTESELYYNRAKKLKEKIMKGRKTSLAEGGEFAIENLVFKKLRNEGKIGKLINITSKFYDMIYSQ